MQKSFKLKVYLGLVVAFVLCGCKSKVQEVNRPAFNADSAYQYTVGQMAFGPRVPNSQAHTQCALYLIEQLRRFGCDVELQKGLMPDYTGRPQAIFNVIGHFAGNTGAKKVLLCAHYDTRPWCDQEEDYDLKHLNVPGANDGATGVAVLLEVARQLQILSRDTTLKLRPMDIVFFDVEDMGTPTTYTGFERENTWCLGSQYWAKELPDEQVNDYVYGILLDMVGAPDAVFPKEMNSTRFAENYVEKIWREAHKLGYGKYFAEQPAYPIVDDHYYVSVYGGIPCVDIIHYDARTSSGFPSWWHTRQDDMRNVHPATLQAVGEVVLATILN